jgi:hypothetical protein
LATVRPTLPCRNVRRENLDMIGSSRVLVFIVDGCRAPPNAATAPDRGQARPKRIADKPMGIAACGV